jgi:hypothetical protein
MHQELRAAAKALKEVPQQRHAPNITPEEQKRLQGVLAQAIKDNEECKPSNMAPLALTYISTL